MSDQQNIQKDIREKKKRGTQADLSAYMFGKVPPQARELEEAVLGAIMLEKDALSNVIDIISPSGFYIDAHARIFNAIYRLFQKSQPVDILTVTEELRLSGELEAVGGPFFIASLTNRVASAANVEYHARIISQKFIQRELIRISSDIIKDAFEDTTDVFELLDNAEKGLFAITDNNLKRNYSTMSNLLSKAINEIDEVRNHTDGVIGVPTGFTDLDRLTSGWQKSDLIIIASRPGMGKTAFTLSIARNAAMDFKKPVALFSLEMSSTQLVKRLISAEAELPADKIRKGNLKDYEWAQLTTLAGKLSEAQIFIDDTPAISIFELRAKCRRLKMQHNIEVVIVDYLQLMSGTGDNRMGNREQEISQISRALKALAKELDVAVIALSQLNRSVETRGGSKRPQLADLRESGAIEQDADLVMFLYRPEYYQITEDEEGNSTRGLCEIIVAKHRNGALDNVWVRFIDKFAKFVPLEKGEYSLAVTGNESETNESNIVTRKSRLNEIEGAEDAPF